MRITSRSAPTSAAIAAKYGNAVGSSTAVIVAPRIALERPLGLISGASACASRAAVSPQQRGGGEHRAAGHDLQHVAKVAPGTGHERQQQLARPQRDDQAAEEIDGEDRQP